MSTPSRFEIPFDDPDGELPPLPNPTIEADIQQLSREICQLDPELADILFGMSFSSKSRAERIAQIAAWGQA